MAKQEEKKAVAEEKQLTKVRVTVGKREGFPGVWSGGRHWTTGTHYAEVDAETLAKLQGHSERGFLVLDEDMAEPAAKSEKAAIVPPAPDADDETAKKAAAIEAAELAKKSQQPSRK
jgi:hypothetical protein